MSATLATEPTPGVRLGPTVLVASVLASSQLHWLLRHGFPWARSWRLALALLPALAVYGISRSARGRALFARLPAFWERGLAQTWILVPGALLDPLFPAVTLAAWAVALLADRRAFVAAWSHRLAALPRPAVTAGLTALALALIALRAPQLLTAPRFWAEDGQVFYRYAYEHGVADALLFYHEYLALFGNVVATLSANLLPVEQAPVPFTYAALLVQCAAVLVIASGHAPFWDTPGKKLVAVLLVLFVQPSEEIWLNTACSQFLFFLIAALILLEDRPPATALRRWSYRALLGVAGLQGVLSCLQTPLYAYKWYRTREREFAVQTGILAAACLVQLAGMVWFGGVLSWRLGLPTWQELSLDTASRHVLEQLNVNWAFWLAHAAQLSPRRLTAFALLGLAAVGLLYFWLWRVLRAHRGARLALLAALGLIAFAVTFSPVSGQKLALAQPHAGMRYFYAPNVLLALVLFGALQRWRRQGGATRTAATAFLLAILLSEGALEYFALPETSVAVYDPKWPKWSAEVSKWRERPEYRLKIAPVPFAIKLKPRAHDSE